MSSEKVSEDEFSKAVAAVRSVASVGAGLFQEERRHPVILQLLAGWAPAIPSVIDGAGNIVAFCAGAISGAPVVFCAHLDTVFSATEVVVAEDASCVQGPGVSDDASGIAALLFLAGRIGARPQKPCRDAIFAFTVGEEGAGGLRGIRHLLDFLSKKKADAALERLLPEQARCEPACLVAIDGALGTVVTRGLYIKRRRVTFRGPGGHSWGAASAPSAIAAAARDIAAIYRIPTRARHTTVNVGAITGGTGVNSIAAECTFEVEVRSVARKRTDSIARRISAFSRKAALDMRLSVTVDVLDERPGGATRPSEKCVAVLERRLREEGISPVRAASSTEANAAMALGIPAVATGVVQGCGVHTLEERFDKTSLRQGLSVILKYAFDLLE